MVRGTLPLLRETVADGKRHGAGGVLGTDAVKHFIITAGSGALGIHAIVSLVQHSPGELHTDLRSEDDVIFHARGINKTNQPFLIEIDNRSVTEVNPGDLWELTWPIHVESQGKLLDERARRLFGIK